MIWVFWCFVNSSIFSHPSDFEYRHEQDFVRARQDKISVPFTRPRPVDVFVIVDYGMYVDSGYVADGYFEGLTI